MIRSGKCEAGLITPTRILIADDARSMRSLIRSAFPYAHRRLEFCDVGDGEQALSAYRQRRYDIAVIDVLMPGMDGIEALSAIRRYDEDAFVVVISGESDPVLEEAALAEGARDFVRKPFTQKAALRMLEMRDAQRRPASVLAVVGDDMGAVTLKFGLDTLRVANRMTRAYCAREALTALNRHYFDVVFVETNLPDCGAALLAQMRAMQPSLYIVSFSDDSSHDAVRAAMSGGGDDYLLKNISLEHLSKMWARFRAKSGG